MKRGYIIVERPDCSVCGGFPIIDGKCAKCYIAAEIEKRK